MTARKEKIQLLFALLAIVGLSAASAALFLPQQSLWFDETTQLTGISLGPVDAARWLIDQNTFDFVIPGDQSPPLSYWAGWFWGRLFGFSEQSLRWLGVLCIAVASGFVFDAGRCAFGLRAGFLAGAFFALSPNVCQYAVEIRSYPLLLLFTAGATASFIRMLDPDRCSNQSVLLLSFWLILGIYNHFYGVVVACALLLSLLGVFVMERRSVRTVLLASAVTGICSPGLFPFLQGAIAFGGEGGYPGGDQGRWYEVTQMVYRLVGHPTLRMIPMTVSITVGAVLILLGAGFFVPTKSAPFARGLSMALATGLLAPILASYFFTTFEPATARYSSWAMVPLFVLAGGALAVQGRLLRAAVIAASVALISCEIVGSSQLWFHGDFYAHTSYRHLRPLLLALPTRETAVVHDASESSAHLLLSLPIHFTEQSRVAQFVISGEGQTVFAGDRLSADPFEAAAQLRPYRFVVILKSQHQTGSEIACQRRHGVTPLGVGAFVHSLEESQEWVPVRHELFMSLLKTEALVLARQNAKKSPTPIGQ